MGNLNHLRTGLVRAWETLTEGWRELVERAGDALTRFHPPRAGGEVQTRDDRLLQRSARWGVLAAELRLDDDAVDVSVEVPGMEPGDFDIDVHDGVLVVRGEKKVERSRRHGSYRVMERAYGAFERAVRLPVPVDEADARARYRRGVLHIRLPRDAAH